MKIGLLLNSINRLPPYSENFRKILTVNDIPYRLLDPNSSSLLEDLKECSHLLFRHSQGDTDLKIYETIFTIAHRMYGIKCMPDFESFWQYEDKIKEYYLLKSHGFPIVDSYIFWNIEHADAFLNEAQFPLVAKLAKGAASSNVVIVNSVEEGMAINRQVFYKGVKAGGLNNKSNLSSIRKAGLTKFGKASLRSFLINTGVIRDKSDFPEWQIQKDSIMYQKYLPNNSFDQRIVVIGNRAFGARRFVRKNDFRASGSGNDDLTPGKIDLRCIELAFSISNKLNFSSMAYDFIYDEDNTPYINEFGYCFADYVIGKSPGYWDEKLRWHEVRNWPQYYQLKDFLQIDDLKAPWAITPGLSPGL
jgi:glutathione synthase/RimK-type ligase-like ATP-grasp enzyme